MSTGSYPFLDIAKAYHCSYAIVLQCAEQIMHGDITEFAKQSAWHSELAGLVHSAVIHETLHRSRIASEPKEPQYTRCIPRLLK